jgi:hypothetical protein
LKAWKHHDENINKKLKNSNEKSHKKTSNINHKSKTCEQQNMESSTKHQIK